MMSFWIFAALLVVIALCYVLPPLFEREGKQDGEERERSNVSIYRDQLRELERDLRDGVLDKDQYEQGRLELQRRLLEDVSTGHETGEAAASYASSGRSTAMILGGAIPLLAIILYFQITPRPLSPQRPMATPEQAESDATAANEQPGAPSQAEIEQRVSRLAERLKENPEDAQGWLMLARSYSNFKRYREASEAYAKATALVGNDAQVWVDYAETLALANDSQLQGKPAEIINKALQLDPKNEKALWLAGSAAFQSENFQQAVSYWEELAKLLPPGSEAARSVAAGIEEARTRIKQ